MNLLLWTGRVGEEHAPILRALKQTGFDGVEVPVFDPGEARHYRQLGKVLDDLGLERTCSSAIPAGSNPLSPDRLERQAGTDYLARLIECCATLGAQALVGPLYQPLGTFTGEGPLPAELSRCAEVHHTVAGQARDAGLVCALEPLNRFECYFMNTCKQASAYLDVLGEPGFGILYDTFHAHIEEQDPLAALHRAFNKGQIRHVHISENDRGTPGRGHAKIRETIHALKSLGYDGWLTIEAFGKAVPELAAATRVWRDFFTSPEEVYTQGYRYIRECWG